MTGVEGLGDRPGQNPPAAYPTGNVQSISKHLLEDSLAGRNLPERTQNDAIALSWNSGDPIIEAQSVYSLPNGELIMSHVCSQAISQSKESYP